jgi:hypothetical protein
MPLWPGNGDRCNVAPGLGRQETIADAGCTSRPKMDLLMSFSFSTFAVEIDCIPTIAFQAKWQAEADRICREWIQSRWDELAKKGPSGIDLPPIFKLRLARSSERAAYEADRAIAELFGEVKIVKLTNSAQPNEPAPQGMADDAPNETALQDRQQDDRGEE